MKKSYITATLLLAFATIANAEPPAKEEKETLKAEAVKVEKAAKAEVKALKKEAKEEKQALEGKALKEVAKTKKDKEEEPKA